MIGRPEERRAAAIEVRAKGRRLEGYAALFGRVADLGPYREKIRTGAFAESLRSGEDVLALVDHDVSRVLARTRSGTLKLSEDSRGLAFDISVPDTTAGRDVLALAERSDLGGMSFGFSIPLGGDLWIDDTRELIRINLAEISVVSAFPAYEGTSVTARAKGLGASPRAEYARRYVELLRSAPWAS